MSLITAQNISVRRNGQTVLSDINFTINSGEIVTTVGPNGSGKTTLMRVLIKAEAPSKGKIIHKAKLRIGYVPQKLTIDHTMPLTVSRFLQLPVKHSEAERNAIIEHLGITTFQNSQMAQLSGGQFQRIMLARALLNKPEILVLDEPTQGLDHQGIASFYQLIEDVRQETGAAILMVSHDLHVVMSASDRVICLNGHICCEGTPKTVESAPEYRALFGGDTKGIFALYRHHHDHTHDGCEHDHA